MVCEAQTRDSETASESAVTAYGSTTVPLPQQLMTARESHLRLWPWDEPRREQQLHAHSSNSMSPCRPRRPSRGHSISGSSSVSPCRQLRSQSFAQQSPEYSSAEAFAARYAEQALRRRSESNAPQSQSVPQGNSDASTAIVPRASAESEGVQDQVGLLTQAPVATCACLDPITAGN